MGSLSFAASLSAPPERLQERPAKTQRGAETAVLAEEPVMRIALSTDARAATISSTAELLNASSLSASPQPLETARVRIESRLLSPIPQSQSVEIVLGRSLSRDDADRLVDSAHRLADEDARAVAEPGNTWRVIVVKQSIEEAERAVATLEGAGFEATTAFQRPVEDNKNSPGMETTPRQTGPPTNRSAIE